MALLPLLLIILISAVGVVAMSGMFNNLFNANPVNNTSQMYGGYTLAKTGVITFDTLLSPVPILAALILTGMVCLLFVGLARRTRF